MKPGKELDDVIATKVMGWKRKTYYEIDPIVNNEKYKNIFTDYWYDQNDREIHLAKTNSRYYYEYEDVWSPSTNIEDAWVIVNKLLEHGSNKFLIEKCGSWLVRFIEGPFSPAETIEMAICKAALKSVGVHL